MKSAYPDIEVVEASRSVGGVRLSQGLCGYQAPNFEAERKRGEVARKKGEWGTTESEVEDELED